MNKPSIAFAKVSGTTGLTLLMSRLCRDDDTVHILFVFENDAMQQETRGSKPDMVYPSDTTYMGERRRQI